MWGGGSRAPGSHVGSPQALPPMSAHGRLCLLRPQCLAFQGSERTCSPERWLPLQLSQVCSLSTLTCLLPGFQTVGGRNGLLSASLFSVLVGFCHFMTFTVLLGEFFFFGEQR